MAATRLCIVDDNVELVDVLVQYLTDSGRYEVLGTAPDGELGLKLIRETAPDVVIIDLVLPNKDGFYVLEELAKNPATKPACIVLSGVGDETMSARAFEKGADYFMLKPFDLELMTLRIDEVCRHKQQHAKLPTHPLASSPKPQYKEPTDFVLDALHDIPIPNTLDGYTYIKTAILLAIEDIGIMESITKRLYPAVAKQHGITAPQVERAMRHAIDTAWRKGGGQNFVRILGYGNPDGGKPTNSAFISALVELYRHTYSAK